MHMRTIGDDIVVTLALALIIYMVLAAVLGLPGGELVQGIRRAMETLF